MSSGGGGAAQFHEFTRLPSYDDAQLLGCYVIVTPPYVSGGRPPTSLPPSVAFIRRCRRSTTAAPRLLPLVFLLLFSGHLLAERVLLADGEKLEFEVEGGVLRRWRNPPCHNERSWPPLRAICFWRSRRAQRCERTGGISWTWRFP